MDCSACKTDLWLSAVVSRAAPGIAVCPEHAATLPGSPQDKTLLFRYTFEELEAMVATAVELIDGTAEAVDFAKQRRQLWKVGPVHPFHPRWLRELRRHLPVFAYAVRYENKREAMSSH